jgi:hypothetical protein
MPRPVIFRLMSSDQLFRWNKFGALSCAVVLLGGGCYYSKPPGSGGNVATDVALGKKAREEGGKKDKKVSYLTVYKGRGDLYTTQFEFRTAPSPAIAEQVSIWDLKVIRNSTAKGAANFSIVRQGMLHLHVFSPDLAWYRHYVPEYKDYGHFVTSDIIPEPGLYHAYSTYTPYYGKEAPGRSDTAHVAFPVAYAGATPPASAKGMVQLPKDLPAPLELAAATDGWFVTETQAAPEGEVAAGAAPTYRVALKADVLPVGENAVLKMQVRDGQDKPVTNLERYLDGTGYVVAVSQDKETFLLAAPQLQRTGMQADLNDSANSETIDGSNLAFATTFPKPGLYKVWAQFKHNGLLINAPFVVRAGTTGSSPAAPKTP